MNKVCLVMYGNHTPEIDAKIIAGAGVIDLFIANTKAGMWKTGVTPQKFQDAGIKVFSYGDGSFETRPLAENLNYIDAIADEGCSGFFLDQVTAYPNPASLDYLYEIVNRCSARKLKLMINTGVSNWSDAIMPFCDLVMSNESWFDTAPSASQVKWQNRVILVSNNMQTVDQAVNRTKAAWARGFPYHYSCSALNYGMPAYFSEYISRIRDTPVPPIAPVPVPVPEPSYVPWYVSLMVGGTEVKIPLTKDTSGNYVSQPVTVKLAVK